jgi:hypothetical protein
MLGKRHATAATILWVAVCLLLPSPPLGRGRSEGANLGDEIQLIADSGFEAFRPQNGLWKHATKAELKADNSRLLQAEGDSGPIIWNAPAGRTANLVTKDSFGDVSLHAEFLIPKGSNSGIKFEGLYEIQIADCYGKQKATASDCGGIYPRAELLPTYHHIDDGFPPSKNACKAPGEWQTLDIVFRAPRFDAAGKKTANARFEKVVLNGQLVQDNVEVPYPTGHAWRKPEPPSGPILLQGDHGPVAFRNIRLRKLDASSAGR